MGLTLSLRGHACLIGASSSEKTKCNWSLPRSNKEELAAVGLEKRPRRDWCLKPAPWTTRPRYPCDHRVRDRIAFQIQRSQKQQIQQQCDFIDENSSLCSKRLALVACPSGLRRWFQAPLSSQEWIRMPLLPIRCVFYCLLKAANATEILTPHLTT